MVILANRRTRSPASLRRADRFEFEQSLRDKKALLLRKLREGEKLNAMTGREISEELQLY